MVRIFSQETDIAVPRQFAFDWHKREGAFERLAPPWEDLRITHKHGQLEDGSELHFRVKVAPGAWIFWQARHSGYEEGVQFCDEQVRGPFALWKHEHRFEETGPESCTLLDRVSYRLRLDPLWRVAPKFLVEEKLKGMFRYRAAVLKHDLERHWRAQLQPQRIAISGAGGLVGSALRPFLTTGGHEVIAISRSRRGDDAKAVVWSAVDGIAEHERPRLEGVDAVVHLAGEPILGIWTAAKKRAIRDSRVVGTRKLCEALAALENKPRVMICGSAIGYYGDQGDRGLTEDSPSGTGFTADVGREWEDACEPARAAGIRVVNLRTGIVLTPKGGALGAMLPAFKMAVGGNLGSGRQYMSWIAIDDLVGLIHHAIAEDDVSGPLNGTAPNPVTNAEFTKTLGKVLNRPTVLPVPAFLLRSLPGSMGEETLLASARVLPAKALATGFKFAYPHLESALRHLLGKPA